MNSRPQIQPQQVAGQGDALAGLRVILQVTRPDSDAGPIRRAASKHGSNSDHKSYVTGSCGE